jgi:uncharacterized protein (TIGR03435 family)
MRLNWLKRFVPLAFLLAANGQAVNGQSQFDVADVHASPQRPDGRVAMMESIGVVRGGRFEVLNATLVDLIKAAYGIEADAISGGPSWLGVDRFDVIAKTTDGTMTESLQLKLQSLLTDRFTLRVRREIRPATVWILARGTGPLKLKPASGSEPAGCRPIDERQRLSCRSVTLDMFAAWLRSAPRATRPIVNTTDLDGEWDFDLDDVPATFMRGLSEDSPMLRAVDRQLGLTLTLRAMPQPAVVIDTVERVPTANVPDVESRLPPDAVEFEAASIKPCESAEPAAWRVSPSGQIRVNCESLGQLIRRAWNLGPQRDTSNGFRALAFGTTPVEGPRWINEKRYEVTAKAPVGIDNPTDAKLRAMLRNLLISRFGIQARFESRMSDAYALVVGTPKPKKGEQTGRAGCASGGLTPTTSPGDAPRFAQVITCSNATMAQFAEALNQTPAIASTRRRVIDETGLPGTWAFDFTLRYGAPSPPTGNDATDPANVPVSVDQAVEQQLGLKLREVKRPLPVFIIDHINDEPTDN